MSYDEREPREDGLLSAARRITRDQTACSGYAADASVHAWIVRCLMDHGERFLRVGWEYPGYPVTTIDEAVMRPAVDELLARVPDIDAQFAEWTGDALRASACICVLIHGTILELPGCRVGADSPLASSSSPLTQQLAGHLSGEGVQFVAHRWSGRNAHEARVRAAQDLDLKLRRLQRESPRARLLLVAHSHGGNVARYALRSPEVAAGVARIICLATPFLTPSDRVGLTERQFGWRFVAAIMWCLFPLFVGMASDLGAAFVFALPALVYLGGMSTLQPVLPLDHTSRDGGDGIAPAIIEAQQLGKMADHAVQTASVYMRGRLEGPAKGPELFVVTAPWDEALKWLQFLAAPSTLIAVALGLVRVLAAVAWAVFLCAFWLLLPGWFVGLRFPSLFPVLFVVFLISGAVAMSGSGITALTQAAANLATRIHRFALGESLAMALYVAPRMSGSPLDAHVHHDERLPWGWSLRHSRIYRNPKVIEKIAGWIRSCHVDPSTAGG